MFLFKHFMLFFLKIFLIFFSIIFFMVCEYHVDILNIQFKLSYSQTNNTQISFDLFQIASLHDAEPEIITITEYYTHFPYNEIFFPNILSESLPVSDSTDCLKYFPGFSAVRHGGTNADLVFRGMFGSRLHVLNGSSEIFGACPCRMDSASAYIFPDTFDIVSIIKGPQTVLWGPVSSAGVVRFERATPLFDQSELRMRSSAMVGSYNRLDKNIDTTFGNVSGYLRLIGSMTQSNDYLDPKKYIIPSAWNKWNTNIAIGFRPFLNFLFEFTISKSNGTAKYAGRWMDALCFSRESFEMRLKKGSVLYDGIYDFDWSMWHHYIDHIMDDSVSYFHKFCTSENFCSSSNALKSKNNVDRIISGMRGIFLHKWREWQIQYGGDLQVDRHRKKMGSGYWQNDFYFQDTGLFFELDWRLTLSNKFVGGIRLEHSLVDSYCFQKACQRQMVIYPAGFIRYEHIFLVPATTMYIGVGFNDRFPDYWELIVLKSSQNTRKDFYHLKPEKNTQLDLGTQLKFNKLDMWGSSYLSYIKDFILCKYYNNNCIILNSSTCASGGNVVRNINALIAGSEMGISYHLDHNWNIENNVSWIFGKNITNMLPLPQLPPLDIQTMLNWRHDSWNTKCVWRLVMSQRRIAVNDGNILSKDKEVSKGFSVFSVNISKEISKSVKLIFGINNLLNKMYNEHLNLTGNKRFEDISDISLHEPGRTWWIRIGVIL